MEKAGVAASELDAQFAELVPVLPVPGTEYMLDMFYTLSHTRAFTEYGPAALNFVEIQAYNELVGERLTPWEVETIVKMDITWLYERAALEKKKNEPTRTSDTNQGTRA